MFVHIKSIVNQKVKFTPNIEMFFDEQKILKEIQNVCKKHTSIQPHCVKKTAFKNNTLIIYASHASVMREIYTHRDTILRNCFQKLPHMKNKFQNIKITAV